VGHPGRPVGSSRTIQSLRLNVEEAMNGKVWRILPEGFRSHECGRKYPLPNNLKDLQFLTTIPLASSLRNGGATYIRRAVSKWKSRQMKRQSAALDIECRSDSIKNSHDSFKQRMKGLSREARQAVNDVKMEAEKVIASMTDLFALGRKGIEGQMKAHLDGADWQGEEIDSRAFRECFRMVAQTVKGLGLPSDQQEKAREVVLEEVAEALKATQEAISLAPGGDEPGVEH